MARTPIATPDRVSVITQAKDEITILADLVRSVGYSPAPHEKQLDWLATRIQMRLQEVEDSLR